LVRQANTCSHVVSPDTSPTATPEGSLPSGPIGIVAVTVWLSVSITTTASAPEDRAAELGGGVQSAPVRMYGHAALA
jgi:hypothetical protein